jgi:hypothetical protein
MLICVFSYLIQTITGGIMKKTSTNKSISGKYYWWAQTAPMEVLTRKTRKTRNQLPKIKDAFHMLRDSAACLFLSELIKGKYDFGGVLYNMPPDVFFPETQTNDIVFSSLPNLSNNDLILHTTRPALNDDKENDKRWLFKSGSELEKIILKNMKNFFLYCNRQYIILSKEVKYDGPYRAIKFNLRIDAHIASNANVYDQLRLEKICKKNKSSRTNKTVGYIVYIPKLINENPKEIGTPGVLSVFGLNGSMTHIWSYIVLTRYPNLVNKIISSNKPRIILAEFSPEISNDVIPNDLSSVVDSVDCEIKVDVTL